ncbi:MAG: histidine--tRNA ligase [Patescibacteria group bacterium]|nr:histidine--tRNA ligase [Patescibacteria group bacterium]
MLTQTLKGFRDFLPKEAKKRQYVIETLKKVFESYGFEPLETPALEYEEILTGKYGEEGDKLMYKFTDNGGRKVALRYDQTVPLARVIAQYGDALPMPFKRYQIQNVWRAENTQKGRYREFLQVDADIVGSPSPLSDAEIIALAVKSLEKLGFKNYKILINDRSLLDSIPKSAISAIDKLKKIGKDGVLKELINKGIPKEKAQLILSEIEKKKPTERINNILSYITPIGVKPLKCEFLPTLARGLDYYTSTIFEIEIDGYSAGSVCGGGRYDNLIGIFAGKQIPAVGFAFGFDRLIEAMEELDLFPKDLNTSNVLVTVFNNELLDKSIEAAEKLRKNGINSELFLDPEQKMEKQLKYADTKGVPYVVIIGPDEAKNNTVTIRNMQTREQKTIEIEKLPDEFKK